MEELKEFISACSDSELNCCHVNLSAKRLKATAEKEEVMWHKINNLLSIVEKEIRSRVANTTLEEYKDLFYSNI